MSDSAAKTIPLQFARRSESDMQKRAETFTQLMQTRRSVRDFSEQSIDRKIIEQCLLAANTAPSGANRQPWYFSVVSALSTKREIREGAEAEEREFYNKRAPQDWLDALAPLGTNADKPFLETAPYLIVVFAQKYEFDADNNKQKNYYVTESASLATGFLIAALHNAGLATLTHTPSPMKFLNKILKRPATEKPLMVLVVGYPATDARVPDIQRKPLAEFASFQQE